MFKIFLLITTSLATSIFAQSLNEIVDISFKKNQDLKSIEQSIQIAKEDIKISKNWQNPIVTLGANDIWFEDTFSRDKEAMQAQYIAISQTIPLGDKLELSEEISKKDLNLSYFELKDKKLQLKSKIFESGYTILILEKKYDLLNKYKSNVEKLITLMNGLYENGNIKQSDILELNIMEKQITKEQISIRNLISNLYLNLEKISFEKISSINESLEPKELSFKTDINTHPKIEELIQKAEIFSDVSKLEKAKKYSDLKVNVGYFQRDDKFKDYANISLSLPLAIHNTEDVKSLKAKMKSNEIKHKLENLKNSFELEIKSLENSSNSYYANYKIIKESIIPLKEEIQKSLESYNSFNLIKPQETIKNLNELIKYEIEMLNELNNYYKTYSKALYYTQG